MKKTLWTFRDSQTFGHGCRPDGPIPEYYYNYISEGDDIWPVHLSKKLNMNLVNLGKCGASNDYIIDCMIKNFDNINEGDYVFVGKTFYQRFDIPNNEKTELYHVLGDLPLYKEDMKQNKDILRSNLKSQEEYETIINFIYLFAQDKLYENRQNLRFNFIKKRLITERKIGFYHEWSVENFNFNRESLLLGIAERILVHTNGKIKDGHFSFNDHRRLADIFYNIILRDVFDIKKII